MWSDRDKNSENEGRVGSRSIRSRFVFVDSITFVSGHTKQRNPVESAKKPVTCGVKTVRRRWGLTARLNEEMFPIEYIRPIQWEGKYIKIKYISAVARIHVSAIGTSANLPQCSSVAETVCRSGKQNVLVEPTDQGLYPTEVKVAGTRDKKRSGNIGRRAIFI